MENNKKNIFKEYDLDELDTHPVNADFFVKCLLSALVNGGLTRKEIVEYLHRLILNIEKHEQ